MPIDWRDTNPVIRDATAWLEQRAEESPAQLVADRAKEIIAEERRATRNWKRVALIIAVPAFIAGAVMGWVQGYDTGLDRGFNGGYRQGVSDAIIGKEG